VDAVLRADSTRGHSGAVALVMRAGRLAFFDSFGYADRSSHRPMRLDSVFRIASMTKPITVVAALMLLEQGKIAAHGPGVALSAGIARYEGRQSRRPTRRPVIGVCPGIRASADDGAGSHAPYRRFTYGQFAIPSCNGLIAPRISWTTSKPMRKWSAN